MSFWKKIKALFSKKKKTAETYVERLGKLSGVMLGHHDDTLVGYDWTEPIGKSDIFDTTGHYPMFMEFDLMGIESGRATYTDEITFDDVKSEAIRQHERGGYIGFSWHMRNPYTGGSVYSLDKYTVSNILVEGSDAYRKFWEGIELGISFLKTIVDSNGKQIPFIFRPFHECLNKSTMWWVADQCETDAYIALWKAVYKKFKNVFGNDIAFAYSPTAYVISADNYLSRYPGDDYVDIFGIEEYQHQIKEGQSISDVRDDLNARIDYNVKATCELAKARGKLAALTECGIYSNQDPHVWSECISHAVKYDILYFCMWRNANKSKKASGQLCYAPYPGEASESDFKQFCSNSDILKI